MGTLKTFSFGACEIAKYSPPKDKLTPNTKIFNINVSFENALKLNLALDECIRKLNKYNRSTKQGKRSAVNFSIHLSQDRITIVEGTV